MFDQLLKELYATCKKLQISSNYQNLVDSIFRASSAISELQNLYRFHTSDEIPTCKLGDSNYNGYILLFEDDPYVWYAEFIQYDSDKPPCFYVGGNRVKKHMTYWMQLPPIVSTEGSK